MGIDSKHPKVRNFSVKFKAFPKDENHVQARACAIPYVTNDIYKKYPKQDYPSKDVAWFDVEVIFNTAFVKENAHKINTPHHIQPYRPRTIARQTWNRRLSFILQ